MHFDCAGSHKMWVTVVALPKVCFTSYVHFVWQVWDSRGILRPKTSFCVTGVGHRTPIHPCVAGVGQNKRWFWRSFCMAGAVFGEFGPMDDFLKGSNVFESLVS